MSNPIEKFRIDTLEAYEEYLRTGEYVSHEDANIWIDALIASAHNESPPLPYPCGRAENS